ncbi:RHS repeat-associated core domain protein [Opitutaceae bacterium TAV1]|nr:RHS repeat-associated core domain protein [Opitutaceae bacterium TAV1]
MKTSLLKQTLLLIALLVPLSCFAALDDTLQVSGEPVATGPLAVSGKPAMAPAQEGWKYGNVVRIDEESPFLDLVSSRLAPRSLQGKVVSPEASLPLLSFTGANLAVATDALNAPAKTPGLEQAQMATLPDLAVAPMAAAATAAATTTATAGNIADEITPEITNLARALQNDPVQIFEFVHNAIEYDHYYGSKRGARLTLLEGAGNDMDQSALMVALIRAAGLTANYVTVVSLVPFDSTAPAYAGANTETLCTGVNWLGLSTASLFPGQTVTSIPAGWTDTEYRKTLLLASHLAEAGFPYGIDVAYKACALMQRTLVKVTNASGASAYFDPSAKQKTWKTPMNFLQATGFDKSTFLTAAGGTVVDNYVTGVSSSAIKTQVTQAATRLATAMKTAYPNASARDVLGEGENVARTFNSFGNWLTMNASIVSESSVLPESVMSKLEVKFNTGSAYTILMPRLQGKRLSLTTESNVAKVWLDDTAIHTASIPNPTFSFTMTARHPHKNSSGAEAHLGTTTSVYKKTGSYALIYAFSPSRRYLQERQRVLDTCIARVRTSFPAAITAAGLDLSKVTDATLKRQVTTETLNVMGLNWMYQTLQSSRLVGAVSNANVTYLHTFGRMAQEEGFYVDVGLMLANLLARDGGTASNNKLMAVAFLGSALEHGIIDQHNSNANSAVSTVQILHLANASTDVNKNRIYLANKSNWSAVKGQLKNYSPDQLTELTNLTNAGASLLIPRNASSGEASWNWKGSGYVSFSPASVGMIITGNYNGGWSVVNSLINPGFVYTSYTASPAYYSSGTISNFINTVTPTFNYPSFYSYDPVDMATGAFVFDRADLSLGGEGVRGLGFARHYSSARRMSNDAGLGYGWTHNYKINATVRTATEAALGETTPVEASAMLASATILNEILKGTPDARSLLSGALVAKVAIDNLLDNAVSITIGQSDMQFVKQPDGTYTPPAGSTMTLTKGSTWQLKQRHGNTLNFDAQGRIANITDRWGKQQTFTYGSAGLQTVKDAYGRTLTFTWSGSNITSVADSTGRSVSFTYTNNDQATAKDTLGKVTTFAYDSSHCLTSIKNPLNQTTVVNRYDSEGRVYEQDLEGNTSKRWKLAFSGIRNTEINPSGGQTIYFYDRIGRPLAVRDALGNQKIMNYDGQDHLIAEATPKGEVTFYSYDKDHNLLTVKNPWNTVTAHTYDASHRRTKTTVTTSDNTVRTTSYAYDSGNATDRPNSVTDPKGYVTKFAYNTDGTLAQQTDPAGFVTKFAYNTVGEPVTVTQPDGSVVTTTWDNRGNPASVKDARGNTTSQTFDTERRPLVSTFPGGSTAKNTYDAAGNLETVTDQLGNVARFTYSASGDVLTETVANGTTDAAVTTHAYDARNWKVTTTDPLSKVTTFAYDAAGRLTSIKDALGKITTFAYDANGQKTSTTTSLGNKITQTYTALGAPHETTDPNGGKTTRAYNLLGEPVIVQNRRGKQYLQSFDANGNPLISQTPMGYQKSNTWDNRNLLTATKLEDGSNITYTYSNVGRVTQQTDPAGTIKFTYDANGNPLTVTEGTQTITRTWDALDRPLTYTNAQNKKITYAWHANGLIQKVTYPSGFWVSYTYYPTNQLKTTTDSQGRVTTWTYDKAGQPLTVTRPNGTVGSFTYDAVGRTLGITEKNAGGTVLASSQYVYDADGRMTSRTRNPAPQAALLPTLTGTYNDDNRLATWNGSSVLHDAKGNMTLGPISSNVLTTYQYDGRNRLTTVNGSTYGYDAENSRIKVNTTTFVVDPHGDGLPRVLESETSGATTVYVYGNGLSYQVTLSDNAVAYYHFDHLGSTVALTNASGAVTDRMEYNAYGGVSYRTGTTGTPFLYVGRLGVQTDTSGLLYMRARYYNPIAMRFINADPIGFAGGMNWFAYADGNPLALVDPSGFCGEQVRSQLLQEAIGSMQHNLWQRYKTETFWNESPVGQAIRSLVPFGEAVAQWQMGNTDAALRSGGTDALLLAAGAVGRIGAISRAGIGMADTYAVYGTRYFSSSIKAPKITGIKIVGSGDSLGRASISSLGNKGAVTTDIRGALGRLAKESGIERGELSNRFHQIKRHGESYTPQGVNRIDDKTGDVFDATGEYIGNVFER